MRGLIIGLLSGLILLAFLAPVQAMGVHAEPARFILEVEAGGRTGGVIKVSNPSPLTVTPTASLQDWDMGSQGQLITKPAGSSQDSLANWIKFNPREFSLAPQAYQYVRFSVDAPRGTPAGERRGIIYFEQRTPHPKGTGATLAAQVGVAVYVAVKPVNRSFELVSARLEPTQDRRTEIVIEVRAVGNAHCRPMGTYRLLDRTGKTVSTGDFIPQPILPGKTLAVRAREPVKGLQKNETYRLWVEFPAEKNARPMRRDFSLQLP